MKILFIGNTTKDTYASIGKGVIDNLIELEFEVYVDNEAYRTEYTKMICNDCIEAIDGAVILGGDGTILEFARTYKDIPVLAINLGRVGALAVAELSNYREYLVKLKKGAYRICDRLALDGKLCTRNGEIVRFTAYNDIFLHRGKSIRMLPIEVALNNANKEILYADGVVVATPTGSTAYNLSAGGPFILPQARCYVLTPICPQFKAITPIVIDEDYSITLSTLDGSEDASLSVDGCKNYTIKSGDIIEICKSTRSLKLIKFDDKQVLFGALHKVATAINK